MRLKTSRNPELERVLREVFPGEMLELQPDASKGFAAARADVEVAIGHMRLLVKIVEGTSTAGLQDAAELLRQRQGRHEDAVAILAAPHFSPAKQELLRASNVAFVDYAGNAWISAPGVHVDRRGFANTGKDVREHRDLFSDKASLVLRTLLKAELPMGVREIADVVSSKGDRIQLTPGYVSKVVTELERQGYAARRTEGIVLRHASELLSDWVAACRSRKRPQARAYFIAAPDAESLIPQLADALAALRVDHVFTGHAGASLVDRYATFDVLDVYVQDLDSAQAALEQLGARRVDRGGNVNLSVPYYRVSAFYDIQVRETAQASIRVASDIQLYLDLHDYPVRGREQAEHLYERRLRPLLERDDRRESQ